MTVPNRGPPVLAVTTATLVLGSVFVVARVVCRLGIVRRFGWDDACIVLAWALALAISLTVNLAVHNGLGRHDGDIDPDRRTRLRLCEYIFSILYNPALMATKTSILIFYLRLSKNTQDVLRWGSYCVLAIVNVAGVVLTFLNIFQCRPVAAAFRPIVGQCLPLLTVFICSAPVNIVTDLAVLSLPIPVLTSMRLPPRQKTILVFTFGLGIFVTVVDVVRIYYLQQAINTVETSSSSDPANIFGDAVEFSWNASFAFMWSAVEVNVGLACACIPTLKPLITKILPAMLFDPDASRYAYSASLEYATGATGATGASGASGVHTHRSDRYQVLSRSNLSRRSHSRKGADASPGLQPQTSRELEPHPSPLTSADHAPAGSGTGTGSGSPPGSRQTNDRPSTQGSATPLSAPAPEEPHQRRSSLAQISSNTRHAFATLSSAARNSPALRHVHDAHRRRRAKRERSTYFGFVTLQTPKNMLEATTAESYRYCTIVAVLFFLWGFSYGLLNTLNNVVADVADMSTAQALGLTSAYFGGGYLFGPLVVGEWVLRHDEHHRRRSSGSTGSSTSYGSGSASASGKNGRHGRHAAHAAHGAHAAASAMSTAVTRHSASAAEHNIGGFKVTFIAGLVFYGIGTIMFWPSSVLTSFPGFLISNFVVGFGLSILETAANPFIALCGPLEYAEVRLLVVQGAQAVGSVLSGLLAQDVFFKGVSAAKGNATATTLLDVQWTYLSITLFCTALAMFFYYIPLPELHDAELSAAASRLPVDPESKTVCGLQLRTVCLAGAVAAQWTYVASQESMSIFFHNLITSWLPERPRGAPAIGVELYFKVKARSVRPNDPSNDPPGLAVSVPDYVLVTRTAFAVARLAAGLVVYLGVRFPAQRWLPSPRTLLLASSVAMTAFAILIVAMPPQANANLVVVPMVLFSLAEGPIFPLIFAIGLRGQGTRTKRAAAYITMGTSGPLFWPFVMYAIMCAGGSIRTAFIVVVALMAVSTMYPLFLVMHRGARLLTQLAPLDPQAPPARASAGCGGSRPARHRPPSDPNALNDIGGLLRVPDAAAAAAMSNSPSPRTRPIEDVPEETELETVPPRPPAP